jgi:hypothetical protein
MVKEINVFHTTLTDLAVLCVVRRDGKVAIIRSPSASWPSGRARAGALYWQSAGRIMPIKTNFADARRRSAIFLLGDTSVNSMASFMGST